MLPHKLQLKIFVTPEGARSIDPELVIGVFHRWIKERRLPELLIDVANYSHVPQGPGVVAIGHGSDYALDQADGRPGLLHNRKRNGFPEAERLGDLVRRTLSVAALLEQEPTLHGRLRFATTELLFRVNDRLAAPNDEETFAALEPELAALAETLFGAAFTLTRLGGPRELFTVSLKTPTEHPLATLLARAGGAPAADTSLV